MFPQITHLNDLLPFIEGNQQFRVQEQPNGTTVVCYMLQDEDTFRGEHDAFYKECRGITFHKDGTVASRTLHKFQNVGENDQTRPDQIPWNDIVRVMDKRDGCCSADTIVVTEDGEKTIKEICDTHYLGKVLVFDFRTNTKVFTKILAHEIKENNDDWYLITLVNGTEIKLTGNHLVWAINRNEYLRVDELTIEDEVLLK